MDITLNSASEGASRCPFVAINRSHGLFGMWEGSFDVRSPEGLVPIAEKFFFHTIAGRSVPAGLESLPPTDWWTTAQLLKHMNLDAAGIFGSSDGSFDHDVTESVTLNVDHVPSEDQSTDAINHAVTAECNEINGGVNNANENSNNCVTTHSENNIIFHPDIKAETSSITIQTVAAPTAVTRKDLDYILGFGKNAFGRFSLFGVFDAKTEEFKCERKYMLSRTSGLKKHSRIVAISHSTDAGGGPLSAAHPASDSLRTSSRTHKVSKHFGGGDDFVAGALPAQRVSVGTQRSRSSSDVQKYRSGSNAHLNNGASASVEIVPVVVSTSSVHLPSMKRKRSQSEVSFNATGTNSASTSSTRHRGNAAQDQQSKSEIKASHHPAPINYYDVHDKTERYRSVFFDEDLGSYYEGWWAFGNRHGEGVCLYADKTLFEGHWNLGREHGKGALMTADRKDIYRGEWADGAFHGHGTYTFSNGDIYTGDWREGNRHGKGEYKITSLGCSYIGDFRDNKRYELFTFCSVFLLFKKKMNPFFVFIIYPGTIFIVVIFFFYMY